MSNTSNFTSLRKIKKTKGEPDEIEKKIAQAIFDIEVNNKDLKTDLQPIYFVAAKEVVINKKKNAIVIFVPEKLAPSFKKIQVKLIRELEKKFAKHVLIIPQRKAIKKPKSGISRPRGRTLAIVHERLLEDVCYPVNVVGKRVRVRTDGTRFSKV
jgi:small subunit ribosomal protein S7e